jgi:hypothetical protein
MMIMMLLNDCKDIPFWLGISHEEHGKLRKEYLTDRRNSTCCFWHLLGAPVKHNEEKPLFDYQQIVINVLQYFRKIRIKKFRGARLTLQQFPLATTFFDLSYYFGDGIILIPALVILLTLRIKDLFFLLRILISLGVIITFLGDILFADYAGDFAWYDMFYNFGYICFALGLIWYYKLSQLLNKNINYCIKESDDLVECSTIYR